MKKRTFTLPIMTLRSVIKACIVICVVFAFGRYFYSHDTEKAVFWMLCATFNLLNYKL